ncbi:MAG: phosphoribosylglycinamide synthetase C domain-containing protein, partial [Candidatus Margulisiibacteriota bacterium]
ILLSCINGNLDKEKVSFKNNASVCVVLASKGYPGNYESGKIIYGLDKIKKKNVQIFHAGTAVRNTQVITSGGRVLGITALAKNIKKAVALVYSIIGKKGIYFRNMHYRKDIGTRIML